MTKTLEVAPETKILIRARELIEQGWTQHSAHRVERVRPHWWSAAETRHSYCVTGAIDRAHLLVGEIDGSRSRGAFAKAIGHSYIQHWNDSPLRTKAEVLAAFDTAISLSMGVPRLP